MLFHKQLGKVQRRKKMPESFLTALFTETFFPPEVEPGDTASLVDCLYLEKKHFDADGE